MMRVLDSPIRSPTRHIKKCSSERTLISRKAQFQLNEILEEVQGIIAGVDHFTANTASHKLQPLLQKAEALYADQNVNPDDPILPFDCRILHDIRLNVTEATLLPTRIAKAIALSNEMLQCAKCWQVKLRHNFTAELCDDIAEARNTMTTIQLHGYMAEIDSIFANDKACQPVSLLSISLMFKLLPLHQELRSTLETYEAYIEQCKRQMDKDVSVVEQEYALQSENVQESVEELQSSDQPIVHILEPESTTSSLFDGKSDDGTHHTTSKVSRSDWKARVLGCDPMLLPQPDVFSTPELPKIEVLQDDEETMTPPSTPPSLKALFELTPVAELDLSRPRKVSNSPSDISLSLDQRINRIASNSFSEQLACVIRGERKKSTNLQRRSSSSPVRGSPASIGKNAVSSQQAGWYTIALVDGEELNVYCRIVGALVMVRVGGGWEELSSFLHNWASHHTPVKRSKESESSPRKSDNHREWAELTLEKVNTDLLSTSITTTSDCFDSK